MRLGQRPFVTEIGCDHEGEASEIGPHEGLRCRPARWCQNQQALEGHRGQASSDHTRLMVGFSKNACNVLFGARGADLRTATSEARSVKPIQAGNDHTGRTFGSTNKPIDDQPVAESHCTADQPSSTHPGPSWNNARCRIVTETDCQSPR